MGTNYNTITYRLVVRNPSPNEARVINIESVLPREITPEDIQDSAGLFVGKDSAKNACYLYKQDVQIPPGEQIVYTVKIWDKWNINKPRIPPLREIGQMLLEKVQSKGTYQSVEKKLTELLEKLAVIEEEKGPEQLSPEYVAFYREQATRLDRIEEAIFRIKDALNPVAVDS